MNIVALYCVNREYKPTYYFKVYKNETVREVVAYIYSEKHPRTSAYGFHPDVHKYKEYYSCNLLYSKDKELYLL